MKNKVVKKAVKKTVKKAMPMKNNLMAMQDMMNKKGY